MFYNHKRYVTVFAEWLRLQACWSIERVHSNIKVYIAPCFFFAQLSYVHVGLVANKSKARHTKPHGCTDARALQSREEKPDPDQDSALIPAPLPAHYRSGVSSLPLLLILTVSPSPLFSCL